MSNSNLAEVIDVSNEGVKLKIEGEKEARNTYYDCVNPVSVGDRVYVQYISGTVIVIGKLLYWKG